MLCFALCLAGTDSQPASWICHMTCDTWCKTGWQTQGGGCIYQFPNNIIILLCTQKEILKLWSHFLHIHRELFIEMNQLWWLTQSFPRYNIFFLNKTYFLDTFTNIAKTQMQSIKEINEGPKRRMYTWIFLCVFNPCEPDTIPVDIFFSKHAVLVLGLSNINSHGMMPHSPPSQSISQAFFSMLTSYVVV